MLELFQTEWCPSSHRVRQRLTELELLFVARPVPAERSERTELRERTGVESIPVLVTEAGDVVPGEEAILAYLAEHHLEPAGAEAHRERAARVKQRELEEACG
ncbi:MAG: glutaredoxin domain-containing protein [Gaiellales bacterium]